MLVRIVVYQRGEAAICSATGKLEAGPKYITPKPSAATGDAHEAAQGSA